MRRCIRDDVFGIRGKSHGRCIRPEKLNSEIQIFCVGFVVAPPQLINSMSCLDLGMVEEKM